LHEKYSKTESREPPVSAIDESEHSEKNTGKKTKEDEAQRETLNNTLSAVEEYFNSKGTQLNFSVDDNTDILQVAIVDKTTSKIIRKIPSDDILKLAASIENTVGQLLDRAL
jgi:flagellar protein FlaG